MAVVKSEEKKEFLISCRKKIGSSITNAPVWILQKAGRRIWNKRQNRHWRSTNLGRLFREKQQEQGKRRIKSGYKKRGRKERSE